MKPILFVVATLALFLTACGSQAMPTIDPIPVQGSAIAMANTMIAMTRMPTVTPFPTQVSERQQLINDVISLLDEGRYSEAYDDKLRLVGSATGKYWNDEEIQALRDFALDMAYIKSGNSSLSAFGGISPDYNGIYHEKISSEILKYISRDEWIRRYEKDKPLKATVVSKLRLPVPQIGMTAQEVLDSQWGKPKDINKTTTANSVNEQWVYDNGKYVYLENGIVVAIQE